MNILAIGATNHKQSINRALATHAADVFKEQFYPDANIDVPDLNDYEVPIFSVERHESDGIPERITALYDKIAQCDFLIISYAEYNGNYTSAWKNLFDWMSRIDQKVFQDKPMLAMATSPGAAGAKSVLGLAQTSAPFFAANIKSVLSVPSFNDNFDMKAGKLIDPSLIAELNNALKQLAE